MKRDLKSMKQQNSAKSETAQSSTCKPEVPQGMLNDVQEAIDRYGGKSDSELINELKQFKQTGAMDTEALYNVASRISPMLSVEQQQKLTSVLSQLTQ